MKWWKYITIDTIAAIVIIAFVLYYIFTNKKKVYKFQGITDNTTKIKKNIFKVKKKKNIKKKKNNKHEERCREIFEELFGEKFYSTRPPWLKNPLTGKNLELDGFCHKIKTHLGYGLAFEYDGKQHSKFTPHYHRNGPQEFVYQVKKDNWKDKKCREEGVLLIRIPYFVAYEDLERYIFQQIKKNGVK